MSRKSGREPSPAGCSDTRRYCNLSSDMTVIPFPCIPAYRINVQEALSEPRFTVALSHDVDRVHKSFQSATHFLKYLRNGCLRQALYQLRSVTRSERYWCFDKIRRIEISRGLRSTFYFLNESYPFNPMKLESWRLALGYYDIFRPAVAGMIRQLDSEGFEIGLHGSYRSYCDRDLLQKEKRDLEAILGHSVTGIRQHYLNLSAETWMIQRDLGFLYDTSFGYRDGIGFKCGFFRPFPLDDRNDFFIVPLSMMDCCLMRQPDPWSRASELIDLAETKKALLVLNWHQQIFDEREFPGYCSMYERIIDECISRGAVFVTLGAYVAGYAALMHSPSATGRESPSL